MMTGWLGGIGQANKAQGAYRSRLRNEFAEVGAERRFGAVLTVQGEGKIGTRD